MNGTDTFSPLENTKDQGRKIKKTLVRNERYSVSERLDKEYMTYIHIFLISLSPSCVRANFGLRSFEEGGYMKMFHKPPRA